MNQKIRFKKAVLFMSAFLLLAVTSCSGDDDPAGGEDKGEGNVTVKEVTLSRKTAYGDDWIYYSLEKGKEVTVSEEDHAGSLDWDIAFNRYNVRTNSGLSGKGKGGAMQTAYKSMEACTSVPEGTFSVDVTYSITAPGTGFPPPTMESTANEVLSAAIAFAGPPPTYTPSDYVFIIRTAGGKYVKFMAMSFYDDEGKSGIYSFKYAIRADGSSKF